MRSDPTRAATAILSVRSPAISAIPSRARGFGAPTAGRWCTLSAVAATATATKLEASRSRAGPDARCGDATGACERSDRVAEAAARLDPGVCRTRRAACRHDRADECELRWNGNGGPGAEKRRQREHAGGRRRRSECDCDRGLEEGGGEEQLPGIEAVGERATPGSAEGKREPVRSEECGDGNTGAGPALEVHGQGGDRREVSRRRHERGGGEETQVAAMAHGSSV